MSDKPSDKTLFAMDLTAMMAVEHISKETDEPQVKILLDFAERQQGNLLFNQHAVQQGCRTLLAPKASVHFVDMWFPMHGKETIKYKRKSQRKRGRYGFKQRISEFHFRPAF